MPDITATDASRRFADLLDGVEHRGEHYTIVRHGRAVAHLEPVTTGNGARLKSVLRRRPTDPAWTQDLAETRDLLTIDDRT